MAKSGRKDLDIIAFRQGVAFSRFCKNAQSDKFQAEILLEMLQNALGKELGSVTFNQLAPSFNPHEIEDSLIETLIKNFNRRQNII
jgi:hypothetical protein